MSVAWMPPLHQQGLHISALTHSPTCPSPEHSCRLGRQTGVPDSKEVLEEDYGVFPKDKAV